MVELNLASLLLPSAMAVYLWTLACNPREPSWLSVTFTFYLPEVAPDHPPKREKFENLQGNKHKKL